MNNKKINIEFENYIFMNRSREHLIDSIIQDLLNFRRLKVWDVVKIDRYNISLDKVKTKLDLLYLHNYSEEKER